MIQQKESHLHVKRIARKWCFNALKKIIVLQHFLILCYWTLNYPPNSPSVYTSGPVSKDICLGVPCGAQTILSPYFDGFIEPFGSVGLILPEEKHVLSPAWMYSSSHQIPNWCALEFLCRGEVQHSLGARDGPGSCTGLTQNAQGFPGISLWMCGHSDHPAGAQDSCSAG